MHTRCEPQINKPYTCSWSTFAVSIKLTSLNGFVQNRVQPSPSSQMRSVSNAHHKTKFSHLAFQDASCCFRTFSHESKDLLEHTQNAIAVSVIQQTTRASKVAATFFTLLGTNSALELLMQIEVSAKTLPCFKCLSIRLLLL